MDLRLIVALVSDDYTEKVIDKAREIGATGASVITSGHGEGLNPPKTFFGL
ncbi:MAG: P-II family nitrogen regulator, partial [Aliifodinibius sp.]|nr:P-II family nitrogen regulator [Fodinibius sp.]